jgi:hypothetical protein
MSPVMIRFTGADQRHAIHASVSIMTAALNQNETLNGAFIIPLSDRMRLHRPGGDRKRARRPPGDEWHD